MDTNKFTGGVPMVRIDGTKVRTLRETKGLTQLFLATSVGVTTDTISRWENKRYPTIKKENGLKLAETLEVDIEEILEQDEESAPETPSKTLPESPSEAVHPSESQSAGDAPHEKRRPRVVPAVIFAILFLGFFLLWRFYPVAEAPSITAVRRLPAQVVVDAPFPVAIKVTSNATSPISLIVKEKLPPGSKLLTAVPPYSAYDAKTGEVKWLLKIDGRQVFAYTVKIAPTEQAVQFEGTVAVPKGSGRPGPVQGNSTVKLTRFHWADSNADGRISDEEILTVYDVFNEIMSLGIDIDQVEEIWLGSGYEWNSEKKKFEIFP
ncbi:MAG: helix-turn-helix transcriptional regulator [Pseudomonadota bacterium]